MKRIIFAMMAIAVLASCDKNTETPQPADPRPQVALNFSVEPQTRAFFSTSYQAEAWEKEVKSLDVYAFDAEDKFILRRTLNEQEIAAMSVHFALPLYTVKTSCKFYMVANADYGDVTEIGSLTSRIEGDLADYNGDFSVVSQQSKREAGFVMVDTFSLTIATEGSSNKFSPSLEHVTAKIAIRIGVDEAFRESLNGGTVEIASVKLTRVTPTSFAFPQSGVFAPRTELAEFTQTSHKEGDYFNNLFYVYENGSLAVGERLLLTLTGYRDADGSDATTSDRSPLEYKIELNGSGSGAQHRNSYYRIDAKIKGLAGDGVLLTTSGGNWGAPQTQTVNLGV